MPIIKVEDLAFVRLGAPSLEEMESFPLGFRNADLRQKPATLFICAGRIRRITFM